MGELSSAFAGWAALTKANKELRDQERSLRAVLQQHDDLHRAHAHRFMKRLHQEWNRTFARVCLSRSSAWNPLHVA